jgi:hypothetical protein
MGSKNKDKSSKSKKKKDKKHKKSKKIPVQETDTFLEITKEKGDVPLEEKKKEVDDIIAGQLAQLKETMTKLKKREPPPETKAELTFPLVLPEAPVAKRRTLKAYAPVIETQFYPCKECNLQFVSEPLLLQHQKSH